ncbi:MAG: membrane integrity-associated transporter subunit PqiC [Propionivibrio sp.]|uniref:ABC-type transport auxiliary lipoprotein family protein n=1 Tax=Propionivibrio sp. TaxID=2212460 RepID=UPI001A3FC16F|nr:ABC-type transport auxiliary lipoprotein family protein [Propionivibrio sp.]MBL8413113.1 membrane integrity-associated transporter subunit PqiC [Propionivibrio sp.]
MKKVLILFVASLLSACVGGARNVPPALVYDFGLPAKRLVVEGTWSRLALEVRSPTWTDSRNIDFRLVYEEPLKKREYADSRWASSPGQMLAQQLRQQLGAVSVGGNAAADCLLRVELQEFSQVFDSPQKSRALVQANVSLIDTRRQLVAERQVVIEHPAASPDAHGGVNALVKVSTELGQQLADWLASLEKNNALKSCRSGH